MNTLKRCIIKFLYPFIRLYWRVFKPKTSGARALLVCDSHILLVKNISSKYWSLPGGKIEKGETPEMCLVRELREELALDVVKVDYKLGEYRADNEGKCDTVHIFVVNLVSSHFVQQWELDNAEWFSLDTLPNDISPAALRRINEFKEGKKEISASW